MKMWIFVLWNVSQNVTISHTCHHFTGFRFILQMVVMLFRSSECSLLLSLSQKLTECWYKFWNKALLICCFRKGGRKSSLALLWVYPPREKLPYHLWNMEVAPNCVFSLLFGNALVSVWMHFLTFQKEFPAVPQTCNAWQTRPSDKCTKHKCAKHSCTHTPKNSRRVFLPGSTAICQLPTPEVL